MGAVSTALKSLKTNKIGRQGLGNPLSHDGWRNWVFLADENECWTPDPDDARGQILEGLDVSEVVIRDRAMRLHAPPD